MTFLRAQFPKNCWLISEILTLTEKGYITLLFFRFVKNVQVLFLLDIYNKF